MGWVAGQPLTNEFFGALHLLFGSHHGNNVAHQRCIAGFWDIECATMLNAGHNYI